MHTVTKEFVRELIDFAPTEETRKLGFADTQLEGTVALFNMLARNRFAYLADEVGMGKTYVALGVMALLRYLEPRARIVVIAPRENIQRKWIKELQNFVRDNWKIVGNRVKSIQGGPAWEPVLCGSLRDFAHEALLNPDRDFFLRMTSFSLRFRDIDNRKRLRRQLRELIPWLDAKSLSPRDQEGFRERFGCAFNAAVPETDLVIVDEAHNLKHGFSNRGSVRNHIMGLAFGHPNGAQAGYPWYGKRAKRLLFLSATPFEEDYAAIHRQLDIFGFGNAELAGAKGRNRVNVRDLADLEVPEDVKRKIVGRLMVRRVSGLRIKGALHTKNMYRREWRNGGFEQHDLPMKLEDPKQRLVVALMQKKVAEVLQDERFNNNFQIGMLSSFESFLESVSTVQASKKAADEEDETSERTFDGDQGATDDERKGIDTNAVSGVVESYRNLFGTGLPHPKLDATADALESVFESGEKALVFVRRVATVEELAAKIDTAFDKWIRARMETALPGLRQEIKNLFKRYGRERMRRPDELVEDFPVDEEEHEPEEILKERALIDEGDQGSAQTFFSWFFRGKGPSGILSGAAFQKNRFATTSSAYSTFFEDDYVSWLLGNPRDPLGELANTIAKARKDLLGELRTRAYGHFRGRSQQREGFPRLYVFEAYQAAGLEILRKIGGEVGRNAGIVLQERFPASEAIPSSPPPTGFPDPASVIGATTFFTELVKHPELRDKIWPEENINDFLPGFRRREQRRELLSAMTRLGAPYIDLYLLAVRPLGSFSLRQQSEKDSPADRLVREFIGQLKRQASLPGFHAFSELSKAAECFDLIQAVNFPEVPRGPLHELGGIYGATLQTQVPVGRMSGGVNKRLVRQFRMPGFPLVLVTTNVLQEGEDLHTFCHQVFHYGISWTPSAMEQRTGRIDRIGSLTQRRLDGLESDPPDVHWLQVYYPHLQDTVEVLQVRRVLKRLNQFLRLIHLSPDKPEKIDSRINMPREALEELAEIKPLEGPLKSAFPVSPQWLSGDLGAQDAEHPDVESLCEHLDLLWNKLLKRFEIEPSRFDDPQRKRGVAHLDNGIISPRGERGSQAAQQEFSLELRSQAAGDATLLRCISRVGRFDLNKNDVLDRLYRAQLNLRYVKICVRPDVRTHEDLVSIEGDIMFHPLTTDIEELEALVRRTIQGTLGLKNRVSFPSAARRVARHKDIGAGDDLLRQLDTLVQQEKLPWERNGHSVDVQLWRGGRKQAVRVEQNETMYIFRSIVAGSDYVTRSRSHKRQLAYRIWRKNAEKELVTFVFDKRNRLVGVIEQPIATLDREELRLYIESLAQECDRFEYELTGKDVE